MHIKTLGLSAAFVLAQVLSFTDSKACGGCCCMCAAGNDVARPYTMGNYSVYYEGNRLPPTPVEEKHVYIYNESISDVQFDISTNKSNWSSTEVGAYAVKNIQCDKSLYIRINTGDKTVTYPLTSGDAYHIVWDRENKQWDLHPITVAD